MKPQGLCRGSGATPFDASPGMKMILQKYCKETFALSRFSGFLFDPQRIRRQAMLFTGNRSSSDWRITAPKKQGKLLPGE
jgi:hypothetical protein